MDKKVIGIILGVVIVLGLLTWWNVASNSSSKKDESKKEDIQISSNEEQEGGIVYFYGDGCSHCANVFAFLSENNIDEKVDFEKKEVWKNSENNKELREAAKKCGLDPRDIGVPFVWSNGRCYIGGPSVKNFFKNAAGI
jgi:glutaredoxin